MSTRTDLPTAPPQGAPAGHGASNGNGSAQNPGRNGNPRLRAALRADLGPVKRVGFGTLVRVEMRKMFNTKAARWFCFAIGFVLIGMTAIMFSVNNGDTPFGVYFDGSVQFLGFLLPILGIMTVTSEWGQRTAMTTFALEPRRGRVMIAKLVVTLMLSALIYAVALGVAALGHFAAIQLRGGQENWTVTGSYLGGIAVWLAVFVLMGFAFGLLLQNTPAAIVAFFLLPLALTIFFGVVTAAQPVGEWVDLNHAYAPLLESEGGVTLTGEQWAQVASASAIWLGIPFIFGMLRTMRREVK